MAKILIIEDNQANMKLASVLMINAGHTALCAVDAETGLTLARAEHPDLILMDIQLPGMDGLAATVLLKQDPATATIPVIALTAMAMKEDQEKTRVAGCDAYIAKPLRFRELYAAIDTLLARKKPGAMTNPAATILIVDDAIESRKLLEMHLRPEGYLTLSAANGEEALASVAQSVPDLILLDILMPGTGGYQVASLLKANPATSSIPIIMLTALTDHSARLAALSAGAEEFLTKPVDRAELLLRVRNLLRLKEFRDLLQNHSSILEQQVRARTADLQHFGAAMDATVDAIYLVDRSSMCFVHINESACRMRNQTREELLALEPWVAFSTSRAELERSYDAVIASGVEEKPLEILKYRTDGSQVWGELRRHALRLGDHWTVVTVERDVTERKIADAKVQRLTQLYAALSQCNEAIVRCTGEEELFLQICRAAVEFGGMKMAWIGLVDLDTRAIRVAASFGERADEYLQGIEISEVANSPLGGGPTGIAIRENQPVWCQDFQNDPRTTPWHERGVHVGWGASASLPLHRNGIVVGVFNLYAGEMGAFDKAARNLLIEMATDISFALDNFARESQRKQAAQALAEGEKRYRELFEVNPHPMYVYDLDTLQFLAVNEAALAHFGYSREELLGMTIKAVRRPEDIPELLQRVKTRSQRLEMRGSRHHRKKDGSLIEVEVSSNRINFAGHHARVVLAQNVTLRKAAEARIKYLNRVQAVLSGINALIVRVKDRDALYRGACQIAIETGGFCIALIAMVSPGTTAIVPVASAGLNEELLTVIKGVLSSIECAPKTIVAQAIRDKQAVVAKDLQNDPRIFFDKNYVESGVRSMAVLPLIISDQAVGVIALYASETEFFHEEEMNLLTELAGDITFAIDHISSEERIGRLNRIRAVTSGITKTIVHVRDRLDLFQQSCRIAVEAGQFPFAWIGVLDPVTQEVTPVAWAGEYAEELTKSKSSARNDVPEGRGLVGQAIRERRPVFNNNNAAQGFGGPRLEEIRRLGFRSQITLPLFEDQTVMGTLTMYTKEPDFFDAEELSLLTDLTRDISFAVLNISRQQRLEKLSRVRALSGEINGAIIHIHDRDALLKEACRIAVEAGGFSLAWTAVVDQTAMQLKLTACEGLGQDYVERMPLSLNEADTENFGLAGRAVCENKPMIVEDMQHDPRIRLHRDAAEQNFHSLVTLPLVVTDTVVGVLALYAHETGFFSENEMALILEMTGNISFALEYIEKESKLNYLAYYDTLTGLANRTLFLERVAQYMRSAASSGHNLALFLIDLERFKNINDSLGRPAGDALLKQVAVWMTRSTGDVNLLARMGADHFAMVMPDVRQDGDLAWIIEKKLTAFLGHPFQLNDAVFRVAAKIGIAVFPNDAADAETLFKNAEAALKKAKATGEHYLFYTQKMTEAVAAKLTLENQLRHALDNEEFVLHYQPKTNSVSGKVTGAEALIRWNDPRTGLVSPGRFIPIMEETGLIYEVGRWALKKAVEDYLRWRAAGLPAVRIAVNVSSRQLQNRGFLDEIRQVISIDKHAAAGLELEITESLIMQDIVHNIASLQAIRDMGISTTIDDFGTGFSSLSYLAKLPVDTLKIDRSFVIAMTAGPEGLALVSTIITLAHSIKLKVVAEGVETEEQSRLLLLLGCDEMQGFLFSKPVPVGIFEEKFLIPSLPYT